MRQLVGSNEGASRESRLKAERRTNVGGRNPREVWERENISELDSEKAAKGGETKSARGTRSELRLREGKPTTESK